MAQPGDRRPGESEEEWVSRLRANGAAATKLNRQMAAHNARAAKDAKNAGKDGRGKK
jgi:hypothetical protein